MSRNESQTRFDLIDPMLTERRGWRREDLRLEVTTNPQIDIVYGKGQRRPSGRADYLLFGALTPGTEPVPLAILEAKRESLPPEHGLQQGKGYRVGQLHHVPFVFSSNGAQFVEYDEITGLTSDAQPMTDFPTQADLVARLLAARGLPASGSELTALVTPYAQGRAHLRYYQDAAIRAALEKIARQQAAEEPPRVLLSLATGAGKTRLAAALLKRLFDAGKLGKALFVCDRTELRDNGLSDFQAAFGTDAAEVDTKHPQKNARVLIATYQTLDHDTGADAKFFLQHYPPGFFDVIVIDECHRSAFGDWHYILQSHQKAIQIGLTATPREIRWEKAEDETTSAGIEEDRRRLGDNYRYFGDPVYEYTYLQGVEDGFLAPAALETYDIYHDGNPTPERVRGVERADLVAVRARLTALLTGQAVAPDAVAEKNKGGVFTSAGAGVKTNLVFFDKGRPTERIWYFDLSDIKTGKKTPFTLAHFEEFFRLLPEGADSERSWTVDFARNLQTALEEARPHREAAAAATARAKSLEEAWQTARKAKKATPEELRVQEDRWKAVLREAREAEAKATAIEYAVYDLKAVNPNRRPVVDNRSPDELLREIEIQGRAADEALARLRGLLSASRDNESRAIPAVLEV